LGEAAGAFAGRRVPPRRSAVGHQWRPAARASSRLGCHFASNPCSRAPRMRVIGRPGGGHIGRAMIDCIRALNHRFVIRRSRHRWKRVKAALATARRAPAPCRPPSTVRTTSHQRRGRDISFSSCSSYRRMPCARSTLSPAHLTTSARPTNPQIRIMIVIHSVIYAPLGDQSQKNSRFVAASLLSAATNQK
jgi:hypothetical protein